METQTLKESLTKEQAKDLYKKILTPRMIEQKMLILLRQGKISKWFSGYGQEAISVGCTVAMNPEEYILPMHRNLGVFTTREIPLHRLFAQFMGKLEGFTKGRDRSFHFGTQEYNIVGMISHLGPQLGLADGIALSSKLKESKKATVVFTGDGGASEGDFHESLNTAAVWQLPVLFVVENNQWGLSTPSKEQFRCKQFIDKGIGYGMRTVQIDGNNLVEVVEKMSQMAQEIRENPEPVLVEMITFRMRGHEEASGTKYYPEGLIESWEDKDPLLQFQSFLKENNLLSQEEMDLMEAEMKLHINSEWKKAESFENPKFDAQTELNDVYAPYSYKEAKASEGSKEMRMVDAIQDGLREAMRKHDDLVLMGQDIADYGGVFKITEGFVEEFGKGRVRNTPLCESAILGAGIGLSIAGQKAMVEMQFADFVSEGMTQICNNMAKLHYRWGQNADVVVRMPTGAGVAAGPFHSQSNEAWFTHIPGLKIVYPAFPADAKGLLISAFEDPNPVMFFEHKALYRSLSGTVPQGYYNLPIGKAAIVEEGSEITIVTYGMGVHWALDIAKDYPGKIEIVDVVSLLPLDEETIKEAVRKTGKAIVLHEDTLTGGYGGEIAALINEHCFESLDAPVKRVGSMDTPVPFNATLEQGFLANRKLKEKIDELLAY